MRHLSDSALIEAYQLARKLLLDIDFITLLEIEIKRRSL
ncbi:sporulation histidine kinase inhibitor Sda [Sporosarcina pasteurii]|uniref:Histidine kinase kinA inhibitor n=1 Tax=Sporosarcina pasteurii TaxID=1474 RepID=A0A380CJJ5_SPOPA|nr:sporulation histidine kinase inhibitor Sda [Sporosarcina pasteurii]MDS9472100.1 sporulation histidine kinase inhibitor Sda [Sporosarcina pasteurii]QBQ06818.1 sporulation histidine kinase inhibitor Sda [Sporosarcina pasteurii]SUJ20793.1 Histidine kinase kinA inhibitor [Sporosarcina pasteurii]